MSQPKIFNGYWAGYQPNGSTLDQTPNYVNKVTLFVAGPAPDMQSLSTNYLCSVYPKEQQIQWVRQLQAQGIEVLMSLMDTPSTHWNVVDIPAFVQSVKAEAIDGEWGLNGVDIDLESGIPAGEWVTAFTSLIQEFRSALGPPGSTNSSGQCNSRISVAAYTLDQSTEIPLLQAVGADLDWLNTMAYWNGAQGNEALFQSYLQYVSQVNMGIGVAYQSGSSTDLQQVELTAQFAQATPNCGMMEFLLNNDCPYYTQQAQWTWASAINANLNG